MTTRRRFLIAIGAAALAVPRDSLPFEQPTGYQLVINRKTAMTLGIGIPPARLRQADDVIQ